MGDVWAWIASPHAVVGPRREAHRAASHPGPGTRTVSRSVISRAPASSSRDATTSPFQTISTRWNGTKLRASSRTSTRAPPAPSRISSPGLRPSASRSRSGPVVMNVRPARTARAQLSKPNCSPPRWAYVRLAPTGM